MPHNARLKIVSDIQRHLPPRNPIDSEMGIVDATTLILLQKMMADSYEHGRVVWKENRARCALTGEAESDDLPCGPNSAQRKVEAWLVEAGLLAPDVADESDETESDDENTPPVSPMPPPETPRRRPWHRRLEISIPNKSPSPKSASFSDPGLRSPRSPLSPIKLWSAVQRSTSSLPSVRLKPKHQGTLLSSPPPSPSVTRPVRKKCRSLESAPVAGPSSSSTPQSADPYDTPLVTAFKRAVMLRTITDDDVEEIMRRHRGPDPLSTASSSTPAKPEPRPHRSPEFANPASYRWPAPILPTPPPPLSPLPTRVVNAGGVDITSSPDARWYHFVFLVFAWHVLIVGLSTYLILRVVFKPLVCVVVLYYAVSVGQFVYSFL